jgi:hypothetical protein
VAESCGPPTRLLAKACRNGAARECECEDTDNAAGGNASRQGDTNGDATMDEEGGRMEDIDARKHKDEPVDAWCGMRLGHMWDLRVAEVERGGSQEPPRQVTLLRSRGSLAWFWSLQCSRRLTRIWSRQCDGESVGRSAQAAVAELAYVVSLYRCT